VDSTRRSVVARGVHAVAAFVMATGLLFVAGESAAAVTSQRLPLQGWVTDAGGHALAQGAVVVRVYRQAAGGDSVYRESFPTGISDGVLDILVGVGGGMLLDADSLYHLELDVGGDEVVGDGASGRLKFRPGTGSHARPDLESRIATLEAVVGGMAQGKGRLAADAAASRATRSAGALAGPRLSAWQLGVGIARGATAGYRLDADMLLQPCGRFATASHLLDLGPWYLAGAPSPVGVLDGPPPERLRLGPCAPNPFRPSTAIRFGLPMAATVRLVVHDLAGRRVRGLVDGWLDAGWHRVDWDGRSDAGQPMVSGLYFCRLEAAGASRITRLTLVR
jgi:hypothetical protein